VHHSDRGVQ
jgi:hypothetical protein